jgi:hypothetical protein
VSFRSFRECMRRRLADGAFDLPPLGEGNTRERWRRLAALAHRDVSTARIAEAHVDAVQILREADRVPDPGQILGVWASESPGHTVHALGDGAFRLRGSKAFCTGAGIVDRALVTATSDRGRILLLVPTNELADARVDTSPWRAHALRDTRTATIDFDDIVLPPDALIREPEWYLERPGFWPGAVGPAACWAGAAFGLVDYALSQPGADPHTRAHRGALSSARWLLSAVLDQAGDEIDADDLDTERAHARALMVRHVVDTTCDDIQDRFARAIGPRALIFDSDVGERYAALTIYRRQCHAERDLEALGRLEPGHAS